METKKIFVKDAKANMVIAEDVCNDENDLIIPKGTILTETLLLRLIVFGINQVRVFERKIEPFIEQKVNNESIKKEGSQQEKLKKSQEFKAFKKQFENTVENVSGVFEGIVTGNENIQIMSLFDNVESIIMHGHNSLHVLDMMQCMREYDDVTFVHCLSVALICNIIGHWIEMDEEDIKVLTIAGLLHDIGKLKVPRELITKPGALTKEEYEIVKMHTIYGYQVLKEHKIDNRIKSAALMHHERCDATGYPSGLGSGEIDTFSKIVAIADVYDAMTANRPYREGICPFDVIEMFEKEGLTVYDPKILIIFMQRTVQSYIHANVKLSNSQIGEIVMINPSALARPLIKTKDEMLDLSKNKQMKIEKIF